MKQHDDPREDDDLVDAVAEGDRTALRALYERHAPWLTLRLARRCADRDLVDEVVQDTFVAVWRGASRYRGGGEVGAWIWGIGARRLVDALRRSGRVPTLLARIRGRSAPSAEEQVLVRVEHGELGPAINRLSPELRAVVQATILDGLTSREAGRLLGLPAGTVRTRLMRAKTQLREELA